jgi:hypothetical protein
MDTLVVRSFDDAIDLLLDRAVPDDAPSHIMHHPERPIPDDVWMLYTSDYVMVDPDDLIKPVQGGFAILKPNRTIYEEVLEIVREGNFEEGYGWGGEKGPRTGYFWGVKTFQGLMPYYFHVLHPGHSVELHWCRYNHVSVEPSKEMQVRGTNRTVDRCHTNRDTCEDCRFREFEDISSFHFTICTKPWDCQPIFISPYKGRLCRQALRTWYDWRAEMEMSWGRKEHNFSHEEDGPEAVFLSYGYCKGRGPGSYVPIQLPYGRA